MQQPETPGFGDGLTQQEVDRLGFLRGRDRTCGTVSVV
jgi:hypothetical protein